MSCDDMKKKKKKSRTVTPTMYSTLLFYRRGMRHHPVVQVLAYKVSIFPLSILNLNSIPSFSQVA